MTESFTTTMTVDAIPREAFDAINNVTGWWGRITGSTAAVGDEFVYLVPGVHYCGFRVTEISPGRRIAWLVTGSYLDVTTTKQEWTGTTVQFDIDEIDEGTRITFTHEGLTPEDECYEVCSNAWSMFVNASLKAFIETGEGKPYSSDGDEALTAAEPQQGPSGESHHTGARHRPDSDMFTVREHPQDGDPRLTDTLNGRTSHFLYRAQPNRLAEGDVDADCL